MNPLKTFKFNAFDEPNKSINKQWTQILKFKTRQKSMFKMPTKKHTKNKLQMLILSEHWKYQVHSLASATIPPYLHNEGKHLIVAELQFTN